MLQTEPYVLGGLCVNVARGVFNGRALRSAASTRFRCGWRRARPTVALTREPHMLSVPRLGPASPRVRGAPKPTRDAIDPIHAPIRRNGRCGLGAVFRYVRNPDDLPRPA